MGVNPSSGCPVREEASTSFESVYPYWIAGTPRPSGSGVGAAVAVEAGACAGGKEGNGVGGAERWGEQASNSITSAEASIQRRCRCFMVISFQTSKAAVRAIPPL